MTTQQRNHPKKDSTIEIEPIRSLDDVSLVRDYLRRDTRNNLLFTMGVNTNLRASDLLKLTAGDIDLFWGHIKIKEQKTSKKRHITLSPPVIALLTPYLADLRPGDLLFPSRKGGGQISVSSLNNMVKKWCADCGLRGNFGSHTLRKTWAFIQYRVFGTDLAIISRELNHSSMNVTYRYIGITKDEVRAMYNNFI